MEDENFRYYSDSNGFGNIVQRTNKTTGEQQVYDYWTDGKMRKLTKYEQVPNSTTTMEVDYYFDALGRRVAKKIKTRSNEFTNTYTYLANQDKILLAKSGDDKVQLQVDGQGIDEHWAQINKSGIRTFISDHLGTVINSEVTNDSKITGAFGEVLQATPQMEATTNPLIYGYTGRQFEPETGLYFYRNRVYDQNSGRFMTKDPLGFAGGDTNLYRYVFNNPVNLTDPTGLEVFYNGNVVNSADTRVRLQVVDALLPNVDISVTGGDRYRDNGDVRSSSNNSLIPNSSSFSRHISGQAVDFRLQSSGENLNYTPANLGNAIQGAGFNNLITYPTGRYHIDTDPRIGDPARSICK